MSYESVNSSPSISFQREANAFFAALERTSPDAITACSGWTAHEIVAHLAAAGLEVALNLEAYGEGRPVPPTRSFEEREAPFREMNDHLLRVELPKSIARMSSALDAVLANEPDAVVPWTGRQMVVKTFLTHLRSEFAIHRFDLIGDDEISKELLAQPDLTNHAV
ncbi:maleylpyruvate isomerase N-terminal domain-containing protein, partial [Acidithrix ferrooxidans]